MDREQWGAAMVASEHPVDEVEPVRRRARVPEIFRERRALIALAVALPVAELGILHATGSRSGMPMAPQVTAPSPFGLFHDLRWLLVYHYSWLSFTFEAAAMLIFRALVATMMVRAAWPGSLDKPSFAVAFRRSLLFTLVSAVLLLPWAGLLFGMAITPVSWLFFAAIPPMVLLAVLIHPAAVKSVLRTGPTLRSAGWMVLTFVVMSLSGAAISLVASPLTYFAAAAGGLYNAWAWNGVVRSLTGRESPRLLQRLVAPAGVALLIIAVVAGSAIGFSIVHDSSRLRSAAAQGVARAASSGGTPVLVVRGFGSSWNGHASHVFSGPFDERRFSYAGTAADGSPMPYAPSDTERSLDELVASMDRQVRALSAAAGKPVSVVAESEGALVAKAYIAAHPRAPVQRLIMLSPLIRPGRVYYPPAGRQDWGVATAIELRGLARAIGAISTLRISPQSPLLRDITDESPALQRALECPVAGIPEQAILPLADSVVAPYTQTTSIPIAIVPAFHGGLIGDGRVKKAIVAELTTGTLPNFGAWTRANAFIRAASGAWQVPNLAPTFFPRGAATLAC
ncbi:MAG: hypothetical protein ABR552_02445 [Actinomycetota bacterium]